MSAPRTKPTEQKSRGAQCAVCAGLIGDLAAHGMGPIPKVAERKPSGRGKGGRPHVVELRDNQIMQPIYFMAVLFDHLRQYAEGGPDGPENHLDSCGRSDWADVWRQCARRYLKPNLKWGDGDDVTSRRPGRASGVMGEARFQKHAVWQAARSAVGYLLGIKPKTLQRRIRDLDHFGERIRERTAKAKQEYGSTLKKLATELAASF